MREVPLRSAGVRAEHHRQPNSRRPRAHARAGDPGARTDARRRARVDGCRARGAGGFRAPVRTARGDRWPLGPRPRPTRCPGIAGASPAGSSRPTTSESGSSIWSRPDLLRRGRHPRAADPDAADPGEHGLHRPGRLQPGGHHARDDDGLPRHRPGLGGLRQLPRPLMIGARDMAFPRLNALSYWLFLFGGIVLYASWFSNGGAPDSGWTSSAPPPSARPGAPRTCRRSRSRPRAHRARRAAPPASPAGRPPT